MPEFVSDIVTHIPCDDFCNRKHKNILHKVLTAIATSTISPHFLVSSDDHFYLKETDFDSYPVYYQRREMLQELTQEKALNNYYKSIVDTSRLLKNHGLPIFMTNPHCNTHFDTAIYEKNMYIFEEAMSLMYGGEMNCIMGNLLVANGATPEYIHDIKLMEFESFDELDKRLANAHCFSISDTTIAKGIEKYLARLYPEKCKYER